jgi:hypothetical protein
VAASPLHKEFYLQNQATNTVSHFSATPKNVLNVSLTNTGERFATQAIHQSLRYKREDRSTSANSKKPPLASERSQASIIAEMHFQMGMKDIKQDL